MADLLTATEKVEFADAVEDLFDTFSRDIVVYKTATRLVVSQDPNYNFVFGSTDSTSNETETFETGTYKARISYINDQKKITEISQEINVPMEITKGIVRIKVQPAANEFLKGYDHIEFDGKFFKIISDYRPKYVFGDYYYVYYLQSKQ